MNQHFGNMSNHIPFLLLYYGGFGLMKTIKLTDNQFEQLKEYVIDSCENIMERSLDWGDSDYANNIIDSNEILFDFRSILESV